MHDISNTQIAIRNTKRTSSVVVPGSSEYSSLSDVFKSLREEFDDNELFVLFDDEPMVFQYLLVTDNGGFTNF